MDRKYTQVNVILTENQVSKLKHALKNNIGVTLRLDSRTIGDGNHELFLTQSQMNRLTNAYNPVDIKFSKTQLREMRQRGGLGFNFLGPLLRSAIPSLTKNVVAPLAVQTAASAIDAGVQKAIHGSGTSMNKKFKLCINSDELRDILQVIAALEHSGSLVEGVTETIADKIQKQEGGFLPMLLGSLAASLIPMLFNSGKGGVRAGERTGSGGVRAGEVTGRGIYGDMYGKNRIGIRPR